MTKVVQPRFAAPSSQVSEAPRSNAHQPKPRAWSRMALGLGAALIAAVKSNPGSTALGVLGASGVLVAKYAATPSSAMKSPYPEDIAEFLHNGTFGASFADGARLDGVVVSRGDKLSNVIKDPYNEGGGLILCDRAKVLFGLQRDEAEYATPEGRFALAVAAAIYVRQEFMSLPVLGNGQNAIANIHTYNSQAMPGGSPLLSLTLNNFTAAYFGLGGKGNNGARKPVNTDGKVFLGRVNNASTIYPVVAQKIKGEKFQNDPHPHTDRGMTLKPGMNIPFSEMLIVGGYYFHDTLSIQDAFRQPLKSLRKIPDLYGSSLSFQMLEPIEGKPLFLPFQNELPRIVESLKNG